MKIWRSKLGWSLALLYLCAFVAEYIQYRRNRGTWLADLGLDLLAVPYILLGRVLTGNSAFELHGFEPAGLMVAALFCGTLVYLLGYLIERAIRRLRK